MKLAPTLQLTGLQRRVLKAIDDNWADLTTVGRRCGWGGEGCRRSPSGLWLVVCALQRHGLVEKQPGTEMVRRVGGAK